MQDLEQEYQRFIEFGTILDRKMRRYLVQYLQNKLDPGKYVVPELKDEYFRYFRAALDRLFEIRNLLPLCQKNQRISRQVVLDTLFWLRKTFDKVRNKNPFQEEADRVENWAITPLHLFVKRWPVLIAFLENNYKRENLDSAFYRERFEKMIGAKNMEDIGAADRERIELIINDLLARWDALVQSKILEYQLGKLDEELEQYNNLLEAKVEEYNKLSSLISPFSDYLGWDMSRGLWEDSSFDVVQQYAELLEDEQSLQELADLLGNLREAELELEEESLAKTIIRQEWVSDETVPAEVVGIKTSGELASMLPSEAATLGDVMTEDLFLQKLLSQNLLAFQYEDRRLVKSEDHFLEVNQRIRQKEKGPFIVCVDTSESMRGRPEQVAKVLCLGILKMAIREKRRAYLINFSIGIKTLDLYDVANSVDALAKFLRLSFHGGTDISLPLYEALRQLKTEDYRDADVLVISDFIMYRIEKKVLEEVRYFQQHNAVGFHSLTLGQDPNTEILSFFDTNWQYDTVAKGVVRELGRVVRGE